MTVSSMRAIRYHRYGPANVLGLEEVPRPEPGEGQALVRVHAAGVNPVDWKLRTGTYHDEYPLDLPQAHHLDLLEAPQWTDAATSIPPSVQPLHEGGGRGGRAHRQLERLSLGVLLWRRRVEDDHPGRQPHLPTPRRRFLPGRARNQATTGYIRRHWPMISEVQSRHGRRP